MPDDTFFKPPARDGVAPATLHLPAGEWSTVFECLAAHFAQISPSVWASRFARGRILDGSGQPLSADAPYREGLRVHYYREVEVERAIPFEATILYEDEHLLVVDKPHFLPVTPTGSYVQETLLTRLQRRFDNYEIAPLHRLDRDTAGVVMMSVNRRSRDAYQALFRDRRIQKEYAAIAPSRVHASFPLDRRTRIERGTPFFVNREVPGEPNSHTRIELRSQGSAWSCYALFPTTGKKHQLRVHMAALGLPIRHDPLYPELLERDPYDFSQPLQLLARKLSFRDPLTGAVRTFESHLALSQH